MKLLGKKPPVFVVREGGLWHRRMQSRSVLWLHLIFLSRAIELWWDHPLGGGQDYSKLHGWVSWVPAPPDLVWAALCTTASIVGIYGWWRRRHDTYLIALIFSVSVPATMSIGAVVSNQASASWIQWAILELCVIAEVKIAPVNPALDPS